MSTTEIVQRIVSVPITFDVTEAKIAEVRERYLALKISGIDDKAGYSAVHEARMEVKRTRVAVEKRHKELKADALDYGRRCDAAKNHLIGLLSPIENHLQAEEDRVDAERERIKREAAEAKQRRFADRVSALRDYGYTPLGLKELADASDEDFDVMLAEVRQEYFAEQERKAAAEAERKRLEAEAAEKRRAEEARLAAEAAERRRLEEERLKAERERLAAETAEYDRRRREQEERLKAERQEIERQRRLQEEEAERIAMEKARLEAIERQKTRDEAAGRERLQAEADAQEDDRETIAPGDDRYYDPRNWRNPENIPADVESVVHFAEQIATQYDPAIRETFMDAVEARFHEAVFGVPAGIET